MFNHQKYSFSNEKNLQLIIERGISFEEVIMAIEDGAPLDIIKNPNREKYSNQDMYIVNINNYVYVVPFVPQDANHVF